MYFILLCHYFEKRKKKVASGVLPFQQKTKNLRRTKQAILQQNCFNIVSASYHCGSVGKSSVLLLVTARLKWKKCCQAPKSGRPKTLGPHSRNLRGEWKVINDMLWETLMKLRQRAWLCMRQATAGESEPHSPPRCAQRIQPGTSGGQTPFRSYWFLYKQVILSLFGTGATREKFQLPKTIRIHKRGVKAAESKWKPFTLEKCESKVNYSAMTNLSSKAKYVFFFMKGSCFEAYKYETYLG